MNALAWIVYWLMEAVATFFGIAGMLFDWVILYVFDPDIYNIPAIYNGWTIARDTANLFFIFILLTIAIATILQIERYGAKKLLPNLIIVAFLINFSFLASQYVIFAANSMASLFMPEGYYKSVSFSEQFAAGLQPNAMFSSSEIDIFQKESEYNKKMEKFNQLGIKIQNEGVTYFGVGLPKPTPEEKQEYEKLQEELQEELKGQKENTTSAALRRVIIVMTGNIALLLVATFVLGTVVILLLARIVILWFLMILSPIAFLFWVLPGLESQAGKWWNTLLNQAFWPVGFFFLFNITLNMISGGANKIFGAKIDISKAFISNPTVVLYYLLLVMMLFISLAVAKSMGGAGATMALNLAKGARKYASGYVGGALYRAGVQRVSRGVGRGAELLSTEERRGAIVRGLSRIPLVGGMMGGAVVRQLDKAKTLGGLEKVRARQLESAKLLSSRDRATYISTLGLAARENIINTLPDNEVAQILTNPAIPDAQKNQVESAILRLTGKKQESIRLEQFKLTPETGRPAFFNSSSLSPEMRENFVREKVSATDLAALYHSNAGNIRQTIGINLDQSSAERQQRFASEYGKFILALPSDQIISSFDSLTDNLKGFIINSWRKDEIQKVAKIYDKTGSGGDIVSIINALRPGRVDDALSVLPLQAQRIGKAYAEFINKIDFAEISEDASIYQRDSGGYRVMDMLNKLNTKQVGDIVMRGGKIFDEFVLKLKGMGDNIKEITDKLRAANSPAASWIAINGVKRLGLPRV